MMLGRARFGGDGGVLPFGDSVERTRLSDLVCKRREHVVAWLETDEVEAEEELDDIEVRESRREPSRGL